MSRTRRASASARRCRATCAAAPATCRSSRPSRRPRSAPSPTGRRRSGADDTPHTRDRPRRGGGWTAAPRSPGRRGSPTTSILPRMLHGRLLRSTHPHARIVRVDTAGAERVEGVHLVLTGEAFPDSLRHPAGQPRRARAVPREGPIRRRSRRGRRSRRMRPRPTAALNLIDVEYEPLRTFAVSSESLAHPEPRIHDYGDDGNVHKAVALQFGDVDRALDGADHVFDDVFFFEGNTHLPIEQHATVALKDPDGKLVAVVEHPDAALPAPRARQGAGDAGGAHPRHRHAQRRRLRRQERSRSTTRSSSPGRRCCSTGR